jgi:alpha-tubulin suppressor-like RCC1 family protein
MLSSAFHGTLLRSKSGKYYVVGQYASATGTDIMIPTLITPANGYNYTGEVIDMAAVGSNSSYALATTEGIWVWGYLNTNFILPGVTSSAASPFQKVTLPSEIDPKNIKSISASTNNFMILLNDGTIYTYGKSNAPLNGAGLTTATAAFTKVLIAPNTPLTNIAQIEATSDGSFAADVTNNKLYTWGTNVYLGNGSAFSTKNYATEMTNPLPNGVGIAMIDATYSTSMTYLILGSNKKVYSMGSGAAGILGQNSTTDLTTWSNVKGKDGVGILENVEYLSAQNSTDGFPAASIILNTGQPLSWGDAGGSQMLGLGNASTLVPKTPDGITPTEIIYVLENGGHLTPMLNDKGEIGNVGHNVSGSFADGSTQNRAVYVFNTFERGTDFSDNIAPTCNPDIDGDGIPNRLDLDTDGDGCSDAKEAGVSGTLLSGNLVNTLNGSLTNTTVNNALAQGAFGSNGLADGVETSANSGSINYASTYVNYAKSATVSMCADFDNDGVADIMDIDDDNDGVLDAIESPDCYLPSTFFASGDRRTSFTVSSEVERVSPANQPKTLIDGDGATVAIGFVNNTTIVNKELYKIMFNYPVPLSQLTLRFVDGNSHFNSGAIVKVQGSNDNATWTDLNTGTTFNTVADNTIVAPFWTANTPNEIFTVTQNQGRYKYYRLYGTAGTVRASGYATEFYFTTATSYEPSFYPKVTCTPTDTDGDGIANNFDLDSDDDGCADAIEAGSSTTVTSTTVYPTGTDTNTNGLLNSYEALLLEQLITRRLTLFMP